MLRVKGYSLNCSILKHFQLQSKSSDFSSQRFLSDWVKCSRNLGKLNVDRNVARWLRCFLVSELRIFRDFPRERLWVDRQTRSIDISENMCSSHRFHKHENFILGEGNILFLVKIISSLIYRCTLLIRHSRNTNLIENFCLSNSFRKMYSF